MFACLAPDSIRCAADLTQPGARAGGCRDLFNRELEVGLGTSLPTNLDPFNYVPPTIGDLFNQDVAVLFGYDAVDK